MSGETLFVPSDAAETPCVLLYIRYSSSRETSVLACDSLPLQIMSNVYAREYVAMRADAVYFALPYEAAILESKHGQPAKRQVLSNLGLPSYSIPPLLHAKAFLAEFYNSQKLLEGIAAVAGGVGRHDPHTRGRARTASTSRATRPADPFPWPRPRS